MRLPDSQKDKVKLFASTILTQVQLTQVQTTICAFTSLKNGLFFS